MEVTVELKGLKDLEARLTELDALGGQKLVRRVLRKIAKPLEQRAKANAAGLGGSGALAASIRIVARRTRGNQIAAVAVTSKARERRAVVIYNNAYKRQRKGIFYGWMVDQGHRTGTKSTGYLRKFDRRSGGYAGATTMVGPRPWFTPAVNASELQAINAFIDECMKAVKRMEQRTGKTPNPDALVPP
jgi:hypothetical protein